MSRPASIDLDALRIAIPCTVSWDAMKGDACKRFCGQCRLNVYDVSEMTPGEATTLIRKSEGRVCLRLHRRADGRVVTKDCGRVRLAIERRVRWMRTAAAALFAAIGLAGCSRSNDRSGAPTPSPTGVDATSPERPLMGDVAIAPPTLMGRPKRIMGEAIAPPPKPPERGSEMGGVAPEHVEGPAKPK